MKHDRLLNIAVLFVVLHFGATVIVVGATIGESLDTDGPGVPAWLYLAGDLLQFPLGFVGGAWMLLANSILWGLVIYGIAMATRLLAAPVSESEDDSPVEEW